jgi:uncharacterized membrane protein YeaQ/YmgE (transglycosylase-associated protein family)
MFVLAAVDLTLGFVAWILIGTIAGRFLHGRDFGPWGDLLIGALGGIIGGWRLGLAASGRDGLILTFFSALFGALRRLYPGLRPAHCYPSPPLLGQVDSPVCIM